MSRFTRTLCVLVALLVVSAAIAVTAGATSKPARASPTSGIVYAALVHTVGKTEYAAGLVTDKVLGKGAVEFALNGRRGQQSPGSLHGTGTRHRVHVAPGSCPAPTRVTINTTSTGVTFTNGKLDLTQGQGAQKGHSIVGTFTGTAKSIAGPYTFNDKGTYK